MAAVVVEACAFSAPCHGVVISDILCWAKNLLDSYSLDRVARFLVAFCKVSVLLDVEKQVTGYLEGLGDAGAGAPSMRRTGSRGKDYVDAFKIATKLVEVVQWLTGKEVKLCSENLSALPPMGFGILCKEVTDSYSASLAESAGIPATPALTTIEERMERLTSIEKKIESLAKQLQQCTVPALVGGLSSSEWPALPEKKGGTAAAGENVWSPASLSYTTPPSVSVRIKEAASRKPVKSTSSAVMGIGMSEKLKSTPIYKEDLPER